MFYAGDKIGPYMLLRELGRGGFGIVWLAERRSSLAAPQVALKVPLDADADLEALIREARLWIQASGHPNVLPVIEAEVYDGTVVIVSEYAAGGSLSAWLKQQSRGIPPLEKSLEITRGILAGLNHLHSQRIVHRDLKPSNILLQGEIPRLTDFGLARVLGTTRHSHGTAGTPAYMAPEAWDGHRSEQSDLWSVGVIVYQMLAGQLPFPQTDQASLFRAITTCEPDPLPPAVPAVLTRVIRRSLEKRPEMRYESAADMLSDLGSGHKPSEEPTVGFIPETPSEYDISPPIESLKSLGRLRWQGTWQSLVTRGINGDLEVELPDPLPVDQAFLAWVAVSYSSRSLFRPGERMEMDFTGRFRASHFATGGGSAHIEKDPALWTLSFKGGPKGSQQVITYTAFVKPGSKVIQGEYRSIYPDDTGGFSLTHRKEAPKG
jgi:serine/threonine protein kinase